MKHRMLSLALACAGVAGSVLLVSAPAAARPGEPKKKDLTELGCRNVVGGTASYWRDRVGGVDLSPVLDVVDPDGDYPDDLQEDSGTATLELVLDAPSCSDVDYTLIVYRSNGEVLTTVTTPGDDTTGASAEQPLQLTADVAYDEDCLMLVATTSVQGVVVDTAPDVVEDYGDVCDGDSPGLTYK